MEIENRVRNLMWTVSGDYSLDTKVDIASFEKSRYISLYDAIKQGAFSMYFDKDAFVLYLLKKLYLGAEETPLVQLGQMAIDMACHKRIEAERPGVPSIRRKAFDAMLEYDFHKMMHTQTGQLKAAVFREELTKMQPAQRMLKEGLALLKSLEVSQIPQSSQTQQSSQGAQTSQISQYSSASVDTMDLIRVTDRLYNLLADTAFEKEHGGLDTVLAVTMQQLQKSDWQDFLEEEAKEADFEQVQRQLLNQMLSMDEKEKQDKEKEHLGNSGVVYLDEESIAKMNSYIELNYGRSYLTKQEQERLNRKICRGAHIDCTLFYTDGILANKVRTNAQSEYARRAKEINLRTFDQNYRMTKQNVDVLTGVLRRALKARSEQEFIPDRYGTLVPSKLWNIGRTHNDRLFLRQNKKENADFAVEVLIDGSGSQRERQGQIALQAYMICEALSNVGIPHRAMSYCTFWDYTVLRRFRDYDEGREANMRLFEFYGSSNNRDGLAVRAAADGLLERPEENKVFIILSDGRPNDVVVNRPNSRNPQPYFGDYAVRDTAIEIRKLRNIGVSVLGVFAGEEQDLSAEKRIFGKDFAYIHELSNFSNVVGRYLKKQLEE